MKKYLPIKAISLIILIFFILKANTFNRHEILITGEHDLEWNYNNQAEWSLRYPLCGGNFQSPLNLNENELSLMRKKKGLSLTNYDVVYREGFTLHNNGHSIEFLMPDTGRAHAPRMGGGRLQGQYFTLSGHLHWGQPGGPGSEHTMNGIRYDAEFHLIHKHSRHVTADDATRHPEGLSVIVLFFIIDDTSTSYPPGWDLFFNAVSNVITYNSTFSLNCPMSLDDFVGDLNNREFYTYSGSLTTPPCSECVTFSIVTEPILIPSALLCQLHRVQDSEGNPLLNNFRGLQRQNNRPMFRSNRIFQD